MVAWEQLSRAKKNMVIGTSILGSLMLLTLIAYCFVSFVPAPGATDTDLSKRVVKDCKLGQWDNAEATHCEECEDPRNAAVPSYRTAACVYKDPGAVKACTGTCPFNAADPRTSSYVKEVCKPGNKTDVGKDTQCAPCIGSECVLKPGLLTTKCTPGTSTAAGTPVSQEECADAAPKFVLSKWRPVPPPS